MKDIPKTKDAQKLSAKIAADLHELCKTVPGVAIEHKTGTDPKTLDSLIRPAGKNP